MPLRLFLCCDSCCLCDVLLKKKTVPKTQPVSFWQQIHMKKRQVSYVTKQDLGNWFDYSFTWSQLDESNTKAVSEGFREERRSVASHLPAARFICWQQWETYGRVAAEAGEEVGLTFVRRSNWERLNSRSPWGPSTLRQELVPTALAASLLFFYLHSSWRPCKCHGSC